MRLCIKADDYGYTKTFNDGSLKTIDEGILTSLDIMLDTPGAVDAMERMMAYPWISVGWHAHFWGRPVLDPKEVPSMVNAEGRFKWRHDEKLKDTVDFDEAYAECRAQIERCILITGKAPDWTSINGDYVLEKARMKVCDEFNIAYGIGRRKVESESWSPRGKRNIVENAKYDHLNVISGNHKDGRIGCYWHDIDKYLTHYDPVKFLKSFDPTSDETIVLSWHPGFLDDYILSDSSLTIARVKDVEALISQEAKNWIKDNNIELVNMRDIINGTSEYQNHLVATKSDLVYRKK